VPLFPRIGFDISGAIINIVKGISKRSCYDLFVWRHYVIQMPLILLSPGNYITIRENGQSAGFSEEVRSELRGEFLFLADTLASDVSFRYKGHWVAVSLDLFKPDERMSYKAVLPSSQTKRSGGQLCIICTSVTENHEIAMHANYSLRSITSILSPTRARDHTYVSSYGAIGNMWNHVPDRNITGVIHGWSYVFSLH
jgi:hypothetical protein